VIEAGKRGIFAAAAERLPERLRRRTGKRIDSMRNKDKFEFFRIGMVTGLIQKEEVVRWADAELLSGGKPDPEVIEVSLAGRLPYSQIIGLMNTFRGNPDHRLPVNMALAYALSKSRGNPGNAGEIIQGIRLIRAEYGIEGRVSEGLAALENDLERNRTGALSAGELHDRLLEFLAGFATYQKDVDEVFGNPS
jgi:hypothetical protein